METPKDGRTRHRIIDMPMGFDLPSMTMDKKLIINVAPTGAFTSDRENPDHPCTPEQIAEAAITSYREGASMWHVHCRDREGNPTKDPGLMKETIDRVLAECPEMITSLNVSAVLNKAGIEHFLPMVEPLLKAGKKYIRAVVLPPFHKANRPVTKASLQESVNYFQENGIVMEFQIHHYEALTNVLHWLIEPGVLKPPYVLNIVLGHHSNAFAGPTGPDPWGHMYLITMMNLMPKEHAVVGVIAGGYNWLPLTVEAILLGIDYVRIGMEDTVWMYPHRPDKIKHCTEVVKKVALLSREVGREIATPAEVRTIMGMK